MHPNEYGFLGIGKWKASENSFAVDVTETELLDSGKCIYAFTDFDGQFLRIGSSKGKLGTRMKAWERDVTKALRGEKSPTPKGEAEQWRQLASGLVWARQGTKVKTPVGEFKCYLDEESVLIGRHLPPLNRSKHR